MRLLAVFSFLFLSLKAIAIPVGFNQAWFHDRYGTQYLDQGFDEIEVQRIFRLTHASGARTLRLWVFETLNFPMLTWNENDLTGIRPDFIRNVVSTLQIARSEGVKVYMTFFDAQVYRLSAKTPENQARFKYLISPEGLQKFIALALRPLLSEIDRHGLAEVISQFDLMNEGDVAVDRRAFREGWSAAQRFMCSLKNEIRGLGHFSNTPVGFSVRWSRILPLPWNLFSDQGPFECTDFFDFHSYNNDGSIPGCQRLRRYSKNGGKRLILGEFGQSYFDHTYDDDLQSRITSAYISNANRCGFSEALAWRLSDIRPGRNPEARYSFEGDSGLRPAWNIIHENNLRP